MIKKILDWMFPKFTMNWDCFEHGVHLKGSKIFDSRGVALRVTKQMNEDYGQGSHWVTDKNGNKV